MKILNPEVNLLQFFQQLMQAKCPLLFLDYDGTLAPFNQIRELAIPYPGILTLIQEIIDSTSTKVVIISGRALETLKPFIKLNNVYDLVGCHGGEFLKEKCTLSKEQKKAMAEGLKVALKIIPEERIEIKPLTIAIHFRNLSLEEKKKLRDELFKAWSLLSEIEIHEFNQGIELRPIGLNKGKAVEKIRRQLKADCIAYLGDDVTDEEAFNVLGNQALKVLVSHDEKNSLADIQIEPPKELTEFLKNWIDYARNK